MKSNNGLIIMSILFCYSQLLHLWSSGWICLQPPKSVSSHLDLAQAYR